MVGHFHSTKSVILNRSSYIAPNKYSWNGTTMQKSEATLPKRQDMGSVSSNLAGSGLISEEEHLKILKLTTCVLMYNAHSLLSNMEKWECEHL